MTVRVIANHASSVWVSLIALAFPLFAQNSSPFEPPNTLRPKQPVRSPAPPKPRVPINTSLELRGIMQWRDLWYFSIYDKADRESHWITEAAGVAGKNIQVKDWDEFASKLKLEVHGQEIELKLKKPSGKPIPIAGRAPSPAKKITPTTNRPKHPSIPRPTSTRKPIVRPTTSTTPRVQPRTR